MAGEQSAAPSVGDSLAEAIEKVEIPQQETTAAAPAPEATPAPAAADDSGRDERGRFKGRDKTADTPAHVAPPAAPAPAGETPAAPAAGAPVEEANAAPSSWKEPVKAKWATLDPEVKAEIQRRERDISVGLQRAAESRKFGDSVYQEVAPYIDILKAEGASPIDAIKTLFETAYTLRHGSAEHKRALMLSMIQQYGIDFNTPVDPARARLEWELDSRKHQEMRAGKQQENAGLQAAVSEVEQFAAQPGHEHMEAVRGHMIALLNAGAASTLQDAYDQAVWANPATRATVQQQQNLTRQQDLNKNRNAAAAVTGAPGAVATAQAVDPKNLRGMLESQFGGGRL